VAACIDSDCVVAECDTGYDDCDAAAEDGCEIDITSHLSNCGFCGNVCGGAPGASATCVSGSCGFACLPGFLDCNSLVGDGCEVAPAVDPANCGSCGRGCSAANGAAVCNGGECEVSACDAGWGDCNAAYADGCESETSTDALNCGFCGNVCGDAPGASATCAAGGCGIACLPGFLDCNSLVGDGCEVDPAVDPANCGFCGRGCSAANGTAVCNGGECEVSACDAGWGDCNTTYADGCESDTSSDVLNCGVCGYACPVPPNTTPACVATVCTIAGCNPGFYDCNGSADDGCEIDLDNDPLHCGSCINDCGADSGCSAGRCACPAPPAGVSAEALEAYNLENSVRAAMGIGCATMVVAINTAAQAHCNYYMANTGSCIANPHVEVAGCPLFTGQYFWNRMAAAGYVGSPMFEDMAFYGDGTSSVQAWINTVYHRIPVLQPWARDIGYGNGTHCDTMDFGVGLATPAGIVATYPYADQTGVPRSFNGALEGPNPPAPPAGWPSGYPIHVFMRNAAITSHVLTVDGSTTPISHVWVDPAGDPNHFLSKEYVLYANAPLAAATRYRVQISATVSGTEVDLDWVFTTQ
jgi:hypothetical protein